MGHWFTHSLGFVKLGLDTQAKKGIISRCFASHKTNAPSLDPKAFI